MRIDRLRQQQRLDAAWTALANSLRPRPAQPDYKNCTCATEATWAALGGDVPALRALTHAEREEDAQAALGPLFRSLGVTMPVSLTQAPPQSEERRQLTEEDREMLVKLGLDPRLIDCKTSVEARAAVRRTD
jgi:hypothetical protein